MIAGTRAAYSVFAYAFVVFAGCGVAAGQQLVGQFNYPSTGYPPWTPASGVPPISEIRNPNTDSLLLKASDALQREGRDRDAIAVLNMVLADKREPPSTSYGDNSRHDACVQLSSIYERRGQVPEALDFAILARDRYRFSEMCGLLVTSVRQEDDHRVRSLREQLNKDSARPSPGRSVPQKTTARLPVR